MGKMLLGLAAAIAVTAVTTPATAGTPEDAFVGIPNAKGAVGTLGFNPTAVGGGGFHGGFVNHPGLGDSHFDRHGHGSSDSSSGVWVNGGQWALYNNRTFASDSYNDWWHDRPDRAYPAWMRNNKNCERQWYAGATLRC
jgi:hypothetical protein